MEVAREILESSLEPSLLDHALRPAGPDEETQETQPCTRPSPRSSSSYTLASDQSVFSRDVDQWIRGGSPTESTGVQNSRVAFVQRSTLTTDAVEGPGMWCVLAMLLPLFSAHTNRWRCSPSAILNTAELFLSHLGRVCSQVRCHVRRLAENNICRELFATAMDMVLVVYAIGFLVLSMYQATIIG